MLRRLGVVMAVVAGVVGAGLAGCATMEDDPNFENRTMSVGIDPSSTGSGSVASADGGIDCEPNCDFDYDVGSLVHLQAIPDAGSFFDQWTNGYCIGTDPLYDVLLIEDRECLARFIRGALLALVQAAGTGSGKVTGDSGISCGGGDTVCTATVPVGDSLTVTAVPDSGSVFAGWTGDCAQYGSNLSITPTLSVDLSCGFSFDEAPAAGNVLTPRGSFTFDHRVEVANLKVAAVYTAGYDGPPQGHIVDFSNPDAPTSPAGAEYSPCAGARGFERFFSTLPQYQDDVYHATCVGSRQGSLSPKGGGFTQLEFYSYAPGGAKYLTGTKWEAVADFEFGRVRYIDRGLNPGADMVTDLTSPLEKTCPFSLAVKDSVLVVAGREGVAGTSTANCENWHGLWRVNLNSWAVDGFTPFGTKLRDLAWYNDMVYVTDFEEDKVHIVNGLTGAYDHFISVGDGPTSVVIEDRPGGLSDRMYVTNWNTNLVKVFDLGTEQEIDSQPSGGVSPVTLMLEANLLVVLNFGDAANSIGAVLKAFSIQ